MATLVDSPDVEVAKPLATSQDKERARQAQALLSRQYRGRPAPEATPLLDQLVYLILRHGLNPRQAKGAFNRLQSEFVDWNEVRVSSESEIEESLVGVLAEKERIAKAAEVKAFLAEIFDRQHRVNMDYMVEWDPAEVEQFLAQLSTLRGNDVGQLLSYLFADSRSPISQNVLRVLKRLGLFQHSVGPERARDEFLDLVGKADLAKLNYLLYQHAAAVCTAKDYDCFHCVLSRLCHRGIERLKEGRKESSMAKTKSTKKAGTKKAAPKKAAKKKPAKKAAPKKATAKKKPAKKAAPKKAAKKATKKK